MIITLDKLTELNNPLYYETLSYPRYCYMVETIEALWRVVEEAKAIVRDRALRIATNPHHAVEMALQMDKLQICLADLGPKEETK